jgi:hypothetical protein
MVLISLASSGVFPDNGKARTLPDSRPEDKKDEQKPSNLMI